VDVILLEKVDGLGEVGDVQTVSRGYARNFLIPRGLAKPATKGELKQVEQHKNRAAKRALAEMADAKAMAERISQMTLTFTARAGEGTKLYGSITSANIADKLSEELGREFDRRKLHLEESLRQLGTHQVPVRLMADVETEVTVVIERKDGDSEETA
jgi:large subunit ribosomal protein L9